MLLKALPRLTSPRRGLVWIVFVLSSVHSAPAQQSGSGASGSGAPGGASSAFGAPPSPATGNAPGLPPGTSPASVPAGTGTGGSATGFGTGSGLGTPAGSGQPGGADFSAPAKPLDSGPTTFSISSGYGKAPEIYVSGEGRLARPTFQTRVSGSIGFDDNVFQTPTHAQAIPDQVIQQQISAGTAAQVVLIPVKSTAPQRIGIIGPPPKTQQIRQVVVPGQQPQFQTIVIPGVPKPKRQSSAISRETVSFEAQTATRRSLFTFDLNLNSDYYWNRPGKKAEYNGDLAIRYLHRFTPRLQVTASLSASYLSQPDLSLINTPTRTGSGNYLVTTAKVDLSYRWTPRFSTVSSLSYNRLDFEQASQHIGNYSNTEFGTEFRYLWSPRVTAVVEGRVGEITYPLNTPLNARSYFLLGGVDWNISRRAAATVRLGESVHTFEQSGKSPSTPYLETTLTYQLGKASVLSWTNRFGFEEPPDPDTEVVSFRTTLNITHFFSPRLRGSLSINAIYRTSKNSVTDVNFNEETLDSALAFSYTLNRHWDFTLNYDYTNVLLHPGDSGYFRDRIFAGFDYAF